MYSRCVASLNVAGVNLLRATKRRDIKVIRQNNAYRSCACWGLGLRIAYEECIRVRHSKITAAKMNAAEVQRAETLYHYLDGVVDKILSHVRNYRMRQEVRRTRKELTFASIAAAVAPIGFAWAANPAVEKPAIVLEAPASEARVALTETGRQKLAPVIGANCVATGLIGVIVLNITIEGFEVVSLKTNDCRIKRFTLNDSLGKISVGPP